MEITAHSFTSFTSETSMVSARLPTWVTTRSRSNCPIMCFGIVWCNSFQFQQWKHVLEETAASRQTLTVKYTEALKSLVDELRGHFYKTSPYLVVCTPWKNSLVGLEVDSLLIGFTQSGMWRQQKVLTIARRLKTIAECLRHLRLKSGGCYHGLAKGTIKVPV